MSDPNEEVARAICNELTSLGLVSKERVATVEKSIRDGTIKAEDWLRAIEASLPISGRSASGKQAK